MDSESRKQQANGVSNGRKRKQAEEEEEEGGGGASTSTSTPTEAEVEEFYAILRRFHSAVRDYRRKCNGRRFKVTEKELKIGVREAEGVDGVKSWGRREEAGENVVGLDLDLNLDPVSDLDSDY